ncbi:ABC transporter ATP-binding protein [Polynucleobacter paneuropaeus]|nr:ABC transporter ATP-binding protein [Polynucleobacter paneuropaeus]
MLIASLSEAFSIGAVFPFLAALGAPEKLMNQVDLAPIWIMLGIVNTNQLILALTIIFGALTIFCGVMRLTLLSYQTKLCHGIGADLSQEIYRRTLYQPYLVHVGRNSSSVIAGVFDKTNTVTYHIVIPTVTIISSLFFCVAVLGLVFWTKPIIALVAFSALSAMYLGVIYFTKQKLIRDGELSNANQTLVLKLLQEGLGGIRDIIIDGTQELYTNIYRNADGPMRHARANMQIIGAFPRYILEALGAVLIATMSYVLVVEGDGMYEAIPILGMFALAAQRLLPIIQQAYQAWVGMKGSRPSLKDVLVLLDQPVLQEVDLNDSKKILFNQAIVFEEVGFKYQSNLDWVIRDVNLTIEKGDCIGLIGKTGSGKSTLADILMGLLQPVKGRMLVDSVTISFDNCRGWQKLIAHVPQVIYLADASIAENIAFGVPSSEIDLHKVRLAAQNAQLASSIESWPEAYKTIVGERGVRLSGGQRQRIGIARALYKEANVIILDEATSALDSHTEKLVMDAIKKIGANLTLIIIAHRLSTLESCNRVIELSNGGIIKSGSYEEMVLQTLNDN